MRENTDCADCPNNNKSPEGLVNYVELKTVKQKERNCETLREVMRVNCWEWLELPCQNVVRGPEIENFVQLAHNPRENRLSLERELNAPHFQAPRFRFSRVLKKILHGTDSPWPDAQAWPQTHEKNRNFDVENRGRRKIRPHDFVNHSRVCLHWKREIGALRAQNGNISNSKNSRPF